MQYTIEDLVDLFHPQFVSVDTDNHEGKRYGGDAIVDSFKMEFDKADGWHLYVHVRES